MNLTTSINDRVNTAKRIFGVLNQLSEGNFTAKDFENHRENACRANGFCGSPALSTAFKYNIIRKTGEQKVTTTYTMRNRETLYVVFNDGKKIAATKFVKLGDFKDDIAAAHGGVRGQYNLPTESKSTNTVFLYDKRYNNYAEYLQVEILPELRATYDKLANEAGL